MVAGRRGRGWGEHTAGGRFLAGAVVGLIAGVVGFVLPVALVLLTAYSPNGTLPASLSVVQDTSLLALLASILFTVSLYLYRGGFAALRPLDRRFWAASILCLVGTLGFVLVIVAAALTLYASGAVTECLQGSPTHIGTCLYSTVAPAAFAGGIGLGLIWLGDFGVVVGLLLAGRRFSDGSLYAAAVAYGALLVVLAGPLLVIYEPDSGLTYSLLAGPLLVLLAPALVASGSKRILGP